MPSEGFVSLNSPLHFSRKQSLGRRLAQLFCVLFGAVGALPLLFGLVLRTERVRAWAEQQTAKILLQQLNVVATFQARVNLWPIELSVENLTVPSNDGGAAALKIRRTRVAPRFFALLAGKLDVGDVVIEAPKIRVRIDHGRLSNLTYKLPKPKTQSKTKLEFSPFSSLSLSDASFDITIDDRTIKTESLDLDITAERRLIFEVFLRSSNTKFFYQGVRHFSGLTPDLPTVDEDEICELGLRARVTTTGAKIRRLSLLGRVDADPKPGSMPRCVRADDESDPNLLALRASDFDVDWSQDKPILAGQVFARAPVSLVNRFVKFLPLTGWLGLRGHVRYDGRTKLPTVQAKVHGEDLVLDRYRLFKELDISARIENDHILIDELKEHFADGQTKIADVDIAPFEPKVPISARRVEVKNIQFPGLMRDLGVTEKTIVAWDFGDSVVTDLKGHLAPPEFEGHIVSHSKDFEVFDRAFNDPARRPMIGIARASVDGRILVKPNALEFRDAWVTFGSSRMRTNLVSIGFDNTLAIDVTDNSEVNLADISPIASIPVSGKAKLGAHMKGLATDPILYGSMSVKDFVFGGFPIGDIVSSKVKFWPLKVEVTDTIAQKGQSQFTLPKALLVFDGNATVTVDALAKSKNLNIRDFLAMWHLEEDPRYQEIAGLGSVDANIHYALGGPEDQCGGGYLSVKSQLHLLKADLFGEHFDGGDGEIGFNWLDQRAGFLGFSIDVPHVSLRKGTGSLIGSFQVRPGAKLTGHAVATQLPLERLQTTAPWGAFLDTQVSAVAEIGGTLDAMTGTVHADLSPLRAGPNTLPASTMTVTIESVPRNLNSIGTTKCGRPIPGPFDLDEYRADKSEGAYRLDGQLLGGQIELNGVRFSRQRDTHVKGNVAFHRLDVGSLLELLPANMRPEQRTVGAFSAGVELEDAPLKALGRASARLTLRELTLKQGDANLFAVPNGGPVVLRNGHVDIPGVSVQSSLGKGITATLELSGTLDHLESKPVIHSTVKLQPLSLEPLAQVVSGVNRLSGQLGAELVVDGPLAKPNLRGFVNVDHGEAELKNFDLPITDIAMRLGLSDNELRIERGHAKIGSGAVEVKGGAALSGFELGMLRLVVQARGLALPERLGVQGLGDADLEVLVDPSSPTFRPRVKGQIRFDGLEYTRPIAMTADVAQLAQRGKRSHVESYDPSDDLVDFDLLLYSHRPLRIHNSLIEAEMEIDKEGLQLLGTNQRFGLRGNVRAVPGGRISLRQSVFEIREGFIRFDDPTRVAPRVDVKATTEYRRYSSQASAQSAPSASSGASAGAASGGGAGGQWRITMHAHGDADQLRIDLTSNPALSQDDIFLLLTVGVTRAELDQAQSTSVGSSVALETLGTLSGADRAVTETIPLIDDFRFGSAYSARTGRTEPTVTIGKRLADKIRASVTSGLAESREVRSNVELRLGPQLSIEGSYDNVNDISSSQLGNLGADVRWRIEFR